MTFFKIKLAQAMKRVTLQFPDLHLLWSFVQTLRSPNIEINTIDRVLSCNCTDTDVTEAIGRYRAKLVDGELIA
jgi:hypothetical protein